MDTHNFMLKICSDSRRRAAYGPWSGNASRHLVIQVGWPMKIKVKICGIKSVADARASVKFGADFLGFNFVPSSPRFIAPVLAQKIIDSLPRSGKIVKVGVFMNQSAPAVNQVLALVKLDLIQFHGSESPKFCASFGLPYIKVFTLNPKTSIKKLAGQMSKYQAKYFLLDRPQQGQGHTLDLKKVSILAKKFPIILAGGLNPENVSSTIAGAGEIVGVDVAGGVESKDKKSLKKIKDFILLAKKFFRS